MLVVNKRHSLSSQEYITNEDFSGEHLITYTISRKENSIFLRLPAITPQKVSKIQLTEAIIEMVKAGLGITVMARWAVTPYLASDQLVTIPITNQGLFRTWYAVTLQAENQPRYLTEFVRHLMNFQNTMISN